eukprot:scaffold2658_cov98-Isochrysis_galbana.AAC.1
MTAPPNTPFELLGASWACPKCKSPKAFFTPLTIEIAGFEENQSFGIGAPRRRHTHTQLLSPLP